MDILRISRHPELLPQAAAWFHGKWGIPSPPMRRAWRRP